MGYKHIGTRCPLSQSATFCFLIHCLAVTSVTQKVERGCHLPTPEVTGLSRGGDIVLGGIMPMHDDVELQGQTFTVKPASLVCRRFRGQNYRAFQAMVFSIEQINKNPNLLPNITMGFRFYDSCRMMQRSIQGSLWLMTGHNQPVPQFCCQRKPLLVGTVGDAGSSGSIVIARLQGLYRVSQISYVSTSPLLSDRHHFPSFLRTIPSDSFQSRGLAQLVLYFGWTWVGILVEDNDYGQLGGTLLKKELDGTSACVAFSENIILSRADRNALHIIQVIKSSSASAIVVFSSDAGLSPLVDEMVRQNLTGRVWIASEGWSTSTLMSMEKYLNVLNMTIGLAIHSGEMPGFLEHLNNVHPSSSPDDALLPKFWEEAFGCKWPDPKVNFSMSQNTAKLCTGAEKLGSIQTSYNDMATLRAPYNIYRAVYAFANALHNLSSCRKGQGPFHQGTCANIMDFQPWQLLHYVKKVYFQTKDGYQSLFNENGEVPAQYDIINWHRDTDGTVRHVTVGSYDLGLPLGQNLIINDSAIHWASGKSQVPLSRCSPSCPIGHRKAGKEGEPVCCFMCLPCPQGEISNQTDSTECSKCPWDKWPSSTQDHCILKSIEFLSLDEILGSSLMTICIFCSLVPVVILRLFVQHRNTPIVKANNRSLSYLLLLSLTLCFLCSLAFIGYPTAVKCLLRQAAFGITFALCVSCILAKTIMVVIAFNATKPNSSLRRWVGPQLSYIIISVCTFIQVLLCVCWLVVSHPFSVHNTHSQPEIIIVECNEGSPVAFWCMLGYLGVLATISFIVAFLARKLPDSFNEAQYITFSMLAFLSVWLSFIPAYLSTKGKYMVAMEIFAILSSSSALVSCIYFPKCYIILLRPEMNSKEYLIRREVNQESKAKYA